MNRNRQASRRGTILAAAVILIPMALVLYALVLQQLEVSLGEAQRNEARVQARLLAESALSLMQSAPPASLPYERTLEGQGVFRLEATAPASAGGAQRVRAIGAANGRRGRYICEIEAEKRGNALIPLGLSQHAEVQPPAPGQPHHPAS